MLLTPTIIKDSLVAFSPEIYLDKSRSFTFQNIQILSPADLSYNEDTLYVGSVSVLKQLKVSDLRNICMVCVGKKEGIDKILSKNTINLFVISEKHSLTDVINCLFAVYHNLNSWSHRLDMAILSGQEYQTIINLGGEIFGENPLLFVNSSYNIIASSCSETPYNDRLNKILQDGYYSIDVTDLLSKMGYQAKGSCYNNAVLTQPPNYMGCPFMLVAFHTSDGTLVGFIAVYFVKDAPTEAQFELFRFFTSQTRNYYFKNALREVNNVLPLESFMADLINHTKEDETYLNDRAKSMHLPLDAPYRLCVIQWGEYSIHQANYIMNRLKTSLKFPFFKILKYHESVIMLLQSNVSSLQVLAEFHESISEFQELLKVCDGHAGFSTTQTSLLKMDVAYKQALAALKHGISLSPGERVFFYSKYYIYDLIYCYSNKYSLEDMYIQKLRSLSDAREGHYDNLTLLRNYILTERSISVTAKIMHMHRNSVIYRLSKIQEMLSINLDDPDVRLRLMISFKILEMINGQLDENPTNAKLSTELPLHDE